MMSGNGTGEKKCHEWDRDVGYWHLRRADGSGDWIGSPGSYCCTCGTRLNADGTETPRCDAVPGEAVRATPWYQALAEVAKGDPDEGVAVEDLGATVQEVVWGLAGAGLILVEECGHTAGADDEPPQPLFAAYPTDATRLALAALSARQDMVPRAALIHLAKRCASDALRDSMRTDPAGWEGPTKTADAFVAAALAAAGVEQPEPPEDTRLMNALGHYAERHGWRVAFVDEVGPRPVTEARNAQELRELARTILKCQQPAPGGTQE